MQNKGEHFGAAYMLLQRWNKKIMANTGTDRKEWTSLNGDEAYGNNSTNVGTKQYYTQTAENLNSSKYPKGWLLQAYNDEKWTQPSASGEMKIINCVHINPVLLTDIDKVLQK